MLLLLNGLHCGSHTYPAELSGIFDWCAKPVKRRSADDSECR